MDRADAAGLRLLPEGEPLPDPRQAPGRHGSGRRRATTSASNRCWGRRSSGRWCGSCRRTSTATTIAWSARSRRCPEGRHCFEFRHESWFVAEVYELLRSHGAALVIGDTPERPFQTHEMTADWTLVRFHRGVRGRRGNYSASELRTWARRIAQWRRRVEVFAYFNNDWEGFAPRNALTLARSLGVEWKGVGAAASRARRCRPGPCARSSGSRGRAGRGGACARRPDRRCRRRG